MTKKRPPPPRARKSMSIAGTHVRATLLLDFSSAAAVKYSQALAERTSGLSVPAAAIARRALFLYALHIEKQAREQQAAAELQAIRSAAAGLRVADSLHSPTTEEQAQAQALERLQALTQAPEGAPLMGFREALHGPGVIAARAAWYADLERRHADLVDSIAATPRARRKGINGAPHKTSHDTSNPTT